MKVELKSNKQTYAYPKLMQIIKHPDVIGLFVNKTDATILAGKSAGSHFQGYEPSLWEDYEGSITLIND